MRLSDRSPLTLAAYALAAALALLELAVLWQALHPHVPAHYRAYYIDRTTTCLPQPVSGDYVLGAELNFRSGGDNTRENRPCGWDGPAGDGMHSIGETSRLRLAAGGGQNLTLMLELTGVTLPGPERQRVIVSANDTHLDEISVIPGETDRFSFDIPAALVGETGFVDIALDYPDAISPGKRVANTYWRSVKLTAASLSPAAPG
ncbi:hypothetical protein SAMN05216456_0110 [Devosia crocina]|uniref:Uncharacterized protein n=1 Tax=Devosia crocina TaxID=429728 RepID=A0A1I7MWI3_9HYPH|nr:hypothetical protein SAMN05216456_0110 [Devosia crocina]